MMEYRRRGLPVWVDGDVTVPAATTLTIVPGQVVKFAPAQYLANSGKLTAIGTPEEPIIFTSYRDDTVGGDANADGAASSPVHGDWESLYINAGNFDTVLQHVEVRYAGTSVA